MQQDLAIINAIAERFCPAPASESADAGAGKLPFHDLIAKRPEEIKPKTPSDSLRNELCLAMHHIYTCESYLQGKS